ncbi:hypothetical protein R69619_00395 [Paraburkholderia nemoris]|uniref:PIN domain-containing protein n=1 Tax=Paraburkholderia nemoris TaxID=2793076 RepID=UPI00190BFC25|nr:PIN domain-containing protein [Paraburkholderia nemoris]MBK3737660.1 DUF4935 domain-containing protein [Paraburkholderia aspalathi]CAE6694170.1 hypothetical protein R69619_00395 [Paraburkholderia nemoris]
MGRPRKRKVLHVMFDTNAIFADGFESLISKAARDAIDEHSRHGDLDVKWIVPEIVRLEREYQMRNSFRSVAAHAVRAEKLFGAEWGISDDSINSAISAAIDRQLEDLNVMVQACDSANVDWSSVMRRACFRLPPFQPGPTEKGFRDAIVCETFYQLVGSLSGRDAAVLVCGDGQMKSALGERLDAAKGARILDDIPALRDEIILRVSHVDPQTASEIEQKGSAAFLNGDDQRVLWVKAGLYNVIWSKFGDEIRTLPSGASSYVMERHDVTPPRLIKKDGTGVFFSTLYTVRSAANIWVPAPQPAPQPAGGVLFALGQHLAQPGGRGLASGAQPVANPTPPAGLLGLLSDGQFVVVPKPAPDVFNIHWSATFSRYKRITRAKFESVERVAVPPPVPT